jgi:predicted alpha/beta-fold hydrolase
LDLEASAAAFDTRGQWLYRGHVLRGLKAMYRRFLSHTSNFSGTAVSELLERLQLPDARGVETIGKIREWDERIVARRHGFRSATDYYHSQRASTRLQELRVPSLVVTTRWDPMVPHATTSPALEHGTPLTSLHAWSKTRINSSLVHWQLPSGGHVAWPALRDPQPSVVHHMLEWLARPEGL